MFQTNVVERNNTFEFFFFENLNIYDIT